MKNISIAFILFFTIRPASSQVDYCSEIAKAIDAAAGNFASNTNFQYYTQNGKLAYLAGFSFVANQTGYIYKDSSEKEIYFYQSVSLNPSDYSTIYSSIEACLGKERDRWTKIEANGNTAVLFSCEKKGVEISIFKSVDDVSIQIEHDATKNIPVLGDAFCSDIQKLITSCNNDFEGVKTGTGETSALGTSYKSNIKLNQRNVNGGSIVIAQDIFDKSKKANTYTEVFSNDDISWSELINALDLCLPAAAGWVKTQNIYNTGFDFSKDGITVSITTGKIFATDNNSTHVITVKSS